MFQRLSDGGQHGFGCIKQICPCSSQTYGVIVDGTAFCKGEYPACFIGQNQFRMCSAAIGTNQQHKNSPLLKRLQRVVEFADRWKNPVGVNFVLRQIIAAFGFTGKNQNGGHTGLIGKPDIRR